MSSLFTQGKAKSIMDNLVIPNAGKKLTFAAYLSELRWQGLDIPVTRMGEVIATLKRWYPDWTWTRFGYQEGGPGYVATRKAR